MNSNEGFKGLSTETFSQHSHLGITFNGVLCTEIMSQEGGEEIIREGIAKHIVQFFGGYGTINGELLDTDTPWHIEDHGETPEAGTWTGVEHTGVYHEGILNLYDDGIFLFEECTRREMREDEEYSHVDTSIENQHNWANMRCEEGDDVTFNLTVEEMYEWGFAEKGWFYEPASHNMKWNDGLISEWKRGTPYVRQ